MKKPIRPSSLYGDQPDMYQIPFQYLPRVLKYYCLNGWSLDGDDKKKNINYDIDFQVAVTIARAKDSQFDGLLGQFWNNLVYIWAFHSEYNLDGFVQYLEENTTDDTWWNDSDRRGNGHKGIREHLHDFMGKDRGATFFNAVYGYATGTNGVMGLEYTESGLGDSKKFGSTERSRVINYLKWLSHKFKAYRDVYEEYYEEEMSVKDIIDSINKNR